VRDGGQVRDRPAMARDHDILTAFHVVQQLAQMGFRLGEIDRDHGDPRW
jgi:hypothetical protein